MIVLIGILSLLSIAGALFCAYLGNHALGYTLLFGGFIGAAILFLKSMWATSEKAPVIFGEPEPQRVEHTHQHYHHHFEYKNVTEGTETVQDLPDGRIVTTRHIKRWH